MADEKAGVELYRQKIHQKIDSDPEWAKKAARILIKMLAEKRDSQK